MKSRIRELKNFGFVVIAVLAAVLSSCSSDDSIIEELQQPAEAQTYTMTVQASKGGDGTRALSLDGKTLNATWAEGEIVEVYQSGSKIGELTAAASADASTTLTGTFASAPSTSADLTFYFHTASSPSYTGQEGTLETIATTYDFCAPATVTTGNFTVNETTKKITVPAGISFGANQQAIIKFTLLDKANDAAISPSALNVTDGTSTVSLTNIPAATYTANEASNVLYVAFPAAGSAKTITLTATVGTDNYTYTTASAKTFANGQYYEIKVKMTKMVCTYTAPTLRTGLMFNGNPENVAGSPQELVNPGSVTNGTMYYSTNGTDWSTDVPTQTNAGNYTVYYKVVPDAGYSGGVASTSLSVTMAKAEGFVDLSSSSSDGWSDNSAKTQEIIIYNHGGTLTYVKSGSNATNAKNLTVSISGNTLTSYNYQATMTLSKARNKDASGVTVFIYSAETENYTYATAPFDCNK